MEDPFARLSVDASNLLQPTTAEIFNKIGVLHIRGVFPCDILSDLASTVTNLLNEMETKAGSRTPYISIFSDPVNYEIMREVYNVLEAKTDVLNKEMQAIRDFCRVATRSDKYVGEFYYAREAIATSTTSASVPLYHQDHPTFMISMTDIVGVPINRFITVWVPLDPIDDETPSIEYVPAKLESELPSTEGGMLDVTEFEDKLPSLPHWVPPVALGDVCLHDQFTIHRSHITDKMTKMRRNIEVRLVYT